MRLRRTTVGASSLSLPHAPSRGQIVMQMGAMRGLKLYDRGAGRSHAPLLAKVSVLMGQQPDNLREGLLRRRPFPLLADPFAMAIYAGKRGHLLPNFRAGRATVNRVVAKRLTQHCAPRVPSSALADVEPRCAHNVRLAKARCTLGASATASLRSLSRSMRDSRFRVLCAD